MPRRILTHPLVLAAALATLAACRAPLPPPTVQPQRYTIGEQVEPGAAGAEVEELIAPYRAQLSTQMNRQLATLATPLTKAQPESSLGNWMTDLLEDASRELFPDHEIAFATQNYGGLRVGEIGAGPLLVSEIYELMPFDNELVLVRLTGAELADFVAHIVAKGGWPVSRSIRVERAAGGSLTIELAGRPVDPDGTYYVSTNDYVAGGGSDSAMLIGKPVLSSGRLVRDLLIDYAGRSQQPISVTADGSRLNLR